MNYLLDTDILVDLLRGDPIIVENLKQKRIVIGEAFISVLSVFELTEGAYLANREAELILTRELINSLNVLNLNQKIASEAGKISSFLKKKGKNIGVGDILIGAIAITENKTIITRNVKHFSAMLDLKMISW